MTDPFDLPVSYRGKELLFPAELVQTGYSHRFIVDVYGREVYFEPDEERTYRAIVDADSMDKTLTVELLKAIAEGIEAVVK